MRRIQLKNNNQVLEVSDESARIAVATGTAKYWAAPVPAAVVLWSVTEQQNGEIAIVAKCSRELCSTFRYTGTPAGAADFIFLHQHAGGVSEKCPAETAAKYKVAKKTEQLQLGDDTREFFGAVNHKYLNETSRFDFPMKP